jgi:hypothetical protein
MSLIKVAVNPVVVALFVVACAGGGVAQPDISHLRGLDIPEGLKQFIGSMMTDIDELKKDRGALQNKTQVVQSENVALRADMQGQIDAVKREGGAPEQNAGR